MNPIQHYLENLKKEYSRGNATEHTYRPYLKELIETICPQILATNEPKRIECGAPDYILTKNEIPIGYIEAKDIGEDLEDSKFNEQFSRYKEALTNLVFTDYLEFSFFFDGKKTTSLKIGEIKNGKLIPITASFEQFELLIQNFCTQVTQTIKSPSKLSEMMAAKAKLMANIIEKSLESDEVNYSNSSLKDQMSAFKEILLHDIESKDFADIYAQTIAYGMFTARLYDPSLQTFSRKEAADLIPKTNPFLRKFFQYIAGYDLDDRITWIVDALAEIFQATDVASLLKGFGKATETQDPIIHFYETFLAKYDPKLRKSRGVWYTPEPIVKFIVKAVDDILKDEFKLSQGLADTSKTKIKITTQTVDKRTKTRFEQLEKEVHKVQILDPATGTGTFLTDIVNTIYKNFKGQEGIWPGYVEEDLIPRLHGFEILMASYAMAHLKLEMILNNTGYKSKKDQRLKIYLTNSLEEHHKETGTLFASWLSQEANEANYAKKNTPVMVVLGNPPYSVSSSNNSEWINNLISDYKSNLNETNIQPLSDDYIKFVRYAEYFIEKNGSGIVALVTNNSFIDGIIHRRMREKLSQTFDKIYIYNLHGNSKKKEVRLDGGKDENVFDIQQGVSVNIFIKKTNNKKTGKIFYYSFLGAREEKYNNLKNHTIKTTPWKEIEVYDPYYFFIPKNRDDENQYNEGFKIDELFSNGVCGIQTKRDDLFVDFNESHLETRIKTLLGKKYDEDFSIKYKIKNSSGYKLLERIDKSKFNKTFIQNILYRPFDYRKIYYDHQLIGRAFYSSMKHMIPEPNIALLCCRQQSTFNFQHALVTNLLSDMCSVSLQTKETAYHFPLYLFPDSGSQGSLNNFSKIPNFNSEIILKIENHLKLRLSKGFTPENIFDYIYACLYSRSYRKKYNEFLKIDFPKIPYPQNNDAFWKLVELGKQLRELHLMQAPNKNFITTYPIDGTNIISKKISEKDWEQNAKNKTKGRVWINETQFFDNVPNIAWNMFIGGYQPAQKWLKERYERKLSFEDIQHYQLIITILCETDRIMSEIDKIDFFKINSNKYSSQNESFLIAAEKTEPYNSEN